MIILIRLDFYQKISEDSERTEEQQTWSLKHGNSEKCNEQNVDQYMTFVVLTKAFGTINRDGHWKIMAKFSYPPGS